LGDVEATIKEIQRGNESLREELILSHKSFVFHYTSFICKRKLDPANDDELSIALIAFNNAIDKFEAGRGRSFQGFARLLIRNSLIDYFRKQMESLDVSLSFTGTEGKAVSREEEVSFLAHRRETEERERAYEMQLLDEELAAFGLNLNLLPKFSPKHNETRQYLKAAAQKISSSADMVNKLYRDRKLPFSEIQLLTGVPRKSLVRWKHYLLTLVIILTDPDLEMLAAYITGRES
jgi:RNA polymerase sigma factor